MQKISRPPVPPPGLTKSEVARARENMFAFMLSEQAQRDQTRFEASDYVLDDSSVKQALRKIFHQRCAFCETATDTRPYRFRPASGAWPLAKSKHAHLYYLWLADAWENLYSVCEQCRPEVPGFFPVTGKRARLPTADELQHYLDNASGAWGQYPIPENAQLLDPCYCADVERHLSVNEKGELIGLSERGKVTIAVFKLNRAELVMRRRRCHEQYYAALLAALVAGNRDDAKLWFDFTQLEYGGSWYLLLRQVAQYIGNANGYRPVLSRTRIARMYLALCRTPESARELEEALEQWKDSTSNEPPPTREVPKSGGARIAKISLENFKSLHELEITLPLEPKLGTEKEPVPSLVILGENSTGKSSILEAIALTMMGGRARQMLGVAPVSYILKPKYMGAPDLEPPEDAQVCITMEDGETRSMSATRMLSNIHLAPADLPVFAYGAFRRYAHKERLYSAHKHIRNLFDSSILSNPESWLLGLDENRFVMVMRCLRLIFAIDGKIDIVERNPVTKRCYITTSVYDQGGVPVVTRTRLSSVSSGFCSVLAMSCDILQGLMDPRVNPHFASFETARAVVLIDEVDAHLHPRWKLQIMGSLRRALPNVTFIATTHDPLCLRGMDDGEVMVLQRVPSEHAAASGKLPVMVEKLTVLPNVKKLSIEQLLTSDFFQLYSTDAPMLDLNMAKVADLLSKDEHQLADDESHLLDAFRRDIAEALPIGSSEAHRLVQEAVALYLKERRDATASRMNRLREQTRARILHILETA